MKNNTYLLLFLFLGVQTTVLTAAAADEAMMAADHGYALNGGGPEVPDADYDDGDTEDEDDEHYDMSEGHDTFSDHNNDGLNQNFPTVPDRDYDQSSKAGPIDGVSGAANSSGAFSDVGQGSAQDIADAHAVETASELRGNSSGRLNSADASFFADPDEDGISSNSLSSSNRWGGDGSHSRVNHLRGVIHAGPQNSIDLPEQPVKTASSIQEQHVLNAKIQDVFDFVSALKADNTEADRVSPEIKKDLAKEKAKLKKLYEQVTSKDEDGDFVTKMDESERRLLKEKIVKVEKAIADKQTKIGITAREEAQSIGTEGSWYQSKTDTGVEALKNTYESLAKQDTSTMTNEQLVEYAKEVHDADLEFQRMKSRVDSKYVLNERYGYRLTFNSSRVERAGSRQDVLKTIGTDGTGLRELSSNVDAAMQERGMSDEDLLEEDLQPRRTADIPEDQRKTLTPKKYGQLQDGIDSSVSDIAKLTKQITGSDPGKLPEREYHRLVRQVEKQLDTLETYHDAQTKEGVSSTSAKRLENREYQLEDELGKLKNAFNDKKSQDSRSDRRQLTTGRKARLKDGIVNVYTGMPDDWNIRYQRRANDELNRLETEVKRHPDEYKKSPLFGSERTIDNRGAKEDLMTAIDNKRGANGYQAPEDINNSVNDRLDPDGLDDPDGVDIDSDDDLDGESDTDGDNNGSLDPIEDGDDLDGESDADGGNDEYSYLSADKLRQLLDDYRNGGSPDQIEDGNEYDLDDIDPDEMDRAMAEHNQFNRDENSSDDPVNLGKAGGLQDGSYNDAPPLPDSLPPSLAPPLPKDPAPQLMFNGPGGGGDAGQSESTVDFGKPPLPDSSPPENSKPSFLDQIQQGTSLRKGASQDTRGAEDQEDPSLVNNSILARRRAIEGGNDDDDDDWED